MDIFEEKYHLSGHIKSVQKKYPGEASMKTEATGKLLINKKNLTQ